MSAITPHSTDAARTREQLVTDALDALAANAEQSRRMYDPSEPIDSALEHLVAAAKLSAGPARQHILAAVADIIAAEKSNRLERSCEKMIAATAEQIGTKGLTVKDAAARLREPLAVLVNPILKGKHAAAREQVFAVIGEAREGLLFDPVNGRIRAGLAGELHSVAKADAFQRVASELIEVTA